MTFNLLRTTFATAVLCTVAGIGALGQQGRGSAPPPAADWPMHNRDVRSTRYSPLDEINASNVSRLAVSWSFQPPGGLNISSITPLVVDGVMYFNSGSQLFALDAATGKKIWTFQADPPFRGSGRGPVYGDGRIYAFGSSDLYAVDAKTGKPVPSFGKGGVVPIVRRRAPAEVPGQVPGGFRPDHARLLDDDAAVLLQRHALPGHAVFRQPAAGRPGRRGGRHDGRDQVGLQHGSAGPAGRWLGDHEGHAAAAPAMAAASGCSRRSIPSSG